MNLFWKSYDSFPRMAFVKNIYSDSEPIPENSPYDEVLVIEEGRRVFKSDGYSSTILDDEQQFYNLKTGDIITIDDRGIVFKAFDSSENEATVFITGQCNSNCVMCPASDNERRFDKGMPEEWMHKFIRYLPEKLAHIVVTGGEPTLRPELFFDVMALIAEKYPEIEVLLLTNGRSFASKAMIGKLIDHCPPYLKVAIPIHAAESGLHDRITQVCGSFVQTVSGIRNLLSVGIGVEIRVVVSRWNCSHLSEIASFIVSHFPQAQVVNFIGLETRGNCAKNYKELFAPLESTSPLIIPAIHILAQAGIDAAIYNYPLCAVDRRYWNLCKQSITLGKIRYMPLCDSCDAKTICGGFFNTTLSMAKPNVFPIHFRH